MRERIVPATQASRARFVDDPALLAADERGAPTFFVSHTWGGGFHHLLQRVEEHIAQLQQVARGGAAACRLMDPHSVYLWLDVFAISQHRGTQQSLDLGEFQASVEESARGTLVVLDDAPSGPTLFTRIWCLYEMHRTLYLRSHRDGPALHMLLPPALRGAQAADAIRAITAAIDLERAEATVASDRDAILDDFQSSLMDVDEFVDAMRQAMLTAWKASIAM